MLCFLQHAVERPPRLVGGWIGAYMMNMFVVAWVLVVGFGLGGWASMTNFIRQINTFGLFAKCYQCPPPMPTLTPTPFPSNAQNATDPAIIPSPSPAPSYFVHHHHYHHGRP